MIQVLCGPTCLHHRVQARKDHRCLVDVTQGGREDMECSNKGEGSSTEQSLTGRRAAASVQLWSNKR